LGLDNIEKYRARLDADPAEWVVLDTLTRITISRFFRERDVFMYLCETALPELHALAAPEPVCIWCAGCAGGEEAYTLAIAAHRKRIPVRILGTDLDEHQISRARRGCYSAGSLKELPPAWRALAFEARGDELLLRSAFRTNVDAFRTNVDVLRQDIRRQMPPGPFHLILCRYLAFMYFDAELQREIAEGLLKRMVPEGLVVLGKHESWPADVPGVVEVESGLRIYRKER
jgi:chemotaxis protein methyltransferase CheR